MIIKKVKYIALLDNIKCTGEKKERWTVGSKPG